MTRELPRVPGPAIPQADSLLRVRRLVEAVANGHAESMRSAGVASGLSERHAAYYGSAALETLGLLEDQGRRLQLSALGHQLLQAPSASDRERAVLRYAIERSPVVQVVAPDLLASARPDASAIALRIHRAAGLGDQTALRRAKSLLAWRDYVLTVQNSLDLGESPPTPPPVTQRPVASSTRREASAHTPAAQLLAIELGRFKSYKIANRIGVAPLTVIIGRNNSGKSTWIQSLLLLKQTLAHPRAEVALHLEGFVDASNLRELTHGWPQELASGAGPTIGLTWIAPVNLDDAYDAALRPDTDTVLEATGVDIAIRGRTEIEVDIQVRLGERDGRVVAESVQLSARHDKLCPAGFAMVVDYEPAGWSVRVSARLQQLEQAPKITVEAEHFLPYLAINRRNIGPRDRHRAWHTAYLAVFAQPMEALEDLIKQAVYLGSTRGLPQMMYRPATATLTDVGVSGEYAAQALHRHRRDVVHYLPPPEIVDGRVQVSADMASQPLEVAVNEVLRFLNVEARVHVDTLGDFGFRLMFGNASIQHVGRGLNHLLPVVELGLIADPLAFDGRRAGTSLRSYLESLPRAPLILLEEPESNLHPKVQSRLAHWFVALAMAGRRLIIESHSDHFVRRLRKLAARAEPNSDVERWLTTNVSIVQVSQDDISGESIATESTLTAGGSIREQWPADFMDEAVDEERDIFDARFDKEPELPSSIAAPEYEHDGSAEPADVSPGSD